MLIRTLKVLAPVFVGVGLLHLILGVRADVFLGASLPEAALTDPVLDSQNRFYGVAFSAYGFLIWVCAGDLVKYRTVLQILLGLFFAAGCARVVSIAIYGLPSYLVLVLLASELILPPILAWWHKRNLDRHGGV